MNASLEAEVIFEPGMKVRPRGQVSPIMTVRAMSMPGAFLGSSVGSEPRYVVEWMDQEGNKTSNLPASALETASAA